jgi:CRISPR-associated endonuclease/helicase Cas3
MQTSPPAETEPDVRLWLHGPESGPADVQVVWRADLTDDDLDDAARSSDMADKMYPTEIVAAVRPSSLEAISLPFVAARRWLARQQVHDLADVEGLAGEKLDDNPGELVLRWKGDDSEVIRASGVRPGDTIVLPATRGGIRNGCFDPTSTVPVMDLAERAALFGRGQAVLRLHPVVLAKLEIVLPSDEPDDIGAALTELADAAPAHTWRKLWLQRVGRAKTRIVVDADEPWTVLQGKRLEPGQLRQALAGDDAATIEDGDELTTDEDDSYVAGRAVPLAAHSADVEELAREYATAVGLPLLLVEDLALAGWLHDIGKADRRFQILLRGGSEITYFKDETPWAKSAMQPGANALQRLAQRRSGYPQGARHEVQSVAMIEQHLDVLSKKAHDLDLVIHLVASHHGHCRPFAPVVVDAAPVTVSLPAHASKRFGTIDFAPASSRHELQRLDSSLAPRFWRLVAKYGWLELCWLEAILRLADHRASEREQSSGGES